MNGDNWAIRRTLPDGAVETVGPIGEVEMRRHLAEWGEEQVEVRQGNVDWVSASLILLRFSELAKIGLYIQRGSKIEGPFTASRAVERLEFSFANDSHGSQELLVRVGENGKWVAGRDYLEAVANQKSLAQPGVRQSRSTQDQAIAQTQNITKESTEVESAKVRGVSVRAPNEVSKKPAPQKKVVPEEAPARHFSDDWGKNTDSQTPDGAFIEMKCPFCSVPIRIPKQLSDQRLRCVKCAGEFHLHAAANKGSKQYAVVKNPRLSAVAKAKAEAEQRKKKPRKTRAKRNRRAEAKEIEAGYLSAEYSQTEYSRAGGGIEVADVYVPGYEDDRYFHDRPMDATQAGYVIPGVVIAAWGVGCLLVAAFAVTWVFSSLELVSDRQSSSDDKIRHWSELAASITLVVIEVVSGMIFIAGGIAMGSRKREKIGIGRLAAVLAALPFPGAIAMPFGIWACFALFSKKAERDFR